MRASRIILFSGFLFIQFAVWGQCTVRFVVRSLPPYHPRTDTIFLAGNFNNWNPGDTKLMLQMHSDTPGITIELPKGMFEYKFTRGSWERVEWGKDNTTTANRRLDLESDTTIEVQIEHWADHFPQTPKKSTASANVQVLDSAFYIPQLNRHRRVWIYLPPSYHQSRKKYPVLYMQDGQNIFDEATSGYGEWGVDEALDTLAERNREIIVVGIDHGGDKRINEYSPYDMERFGKGEGRQYAEFLAKTLKPYIDRHFRTKKDEEHTFIAGSSMGGLISFYTILHYPKVFGGAGVFSPAFWITPALKNIDPKKAKKVKGKIYFYAGNQESATMVSDMLAVFEQMQLHSKAKMESVIRAEGKHDEPTWRAEFPLFYKWLFE